MSIPLQKLVSPRALVASTLMSAETDTALGERQLWLYLANEASIELTYKSAGLAPAAAFWSVTYHNSEAEFDATDVDIVDRRTLATSASFADAVETAMSLIDTVVFAIDDNGDSDLWKIDDVDADDLVHAYDRYIQAANDGRRRRLRLRLATRLACRVRRCRIPERLVRGRFRRARGLFRLP